jgi:outer membrane lipoprotein carrier protein
LAVCSRMDFVKYSRRPRRAIERIAPVFAIVLLSAASARAQTAAETEDSVSATELIERFSADVEDFSARFEQQVYKADGEPDEAPSTGTFSLLRPDRFRWDYMTPDEYQIIADGKSLWEYDVELEQATEAPLSDLADSPAMLLSGQGKVADDYEIHDVGSLDGERWIELVPKVAQDDIKSARIAFRNGVPDALEYVDGLGKTTRIDFSDVEINQGLKARAFSFDPPRGVDIIRADN